MEEIIRKRRRQAYADYDKAIKSPPLSLCNENDSRIFLQFDVTVPIYEKAVPEFHRIIGWAHPDLLH